MIPVRDVIPSRTRPGVTAAALGAMAAALAWPAVREWWLPWIAHAAVLWLAGSTLEDRFGHLRFTLFAVVCAAAAAAAPLPWGRGVELLWAVAGTVAGFITAYLVMFPRSRVLALVPAAGGIEVSDVPAWAIFALWLAVQLAAGWSALTWAPTALDGAALSAAAGAVVGALGGCLLPRPERMQVDWWDPPTNRS